MLAVMTQFMWLSGDVDSGDVTHLEVVPQRTFLVEWIVIPRDVAIATEIHQIRIGVNAQLVRDSVMPAEVFSSGDALPWQKWRRKDGPHPMSLADAREITASSRLSFAQVALDVARPGQVIAFEVRRRHAGRRSGAGPSFEAFLVGRSFDAASA